MAGAQRSMGVEEYRQLVAGGAKARMTNKYGAVAQYHQGHRYDSQAELAFKMHLDLMKANGLVLGYLRQVPVHLPADHGVRGTIYRIDFLVELKTRAADFIDIKGRDTAPSRIKRSVASSILPRPIKLVTYKNGRFDWAP